MRKSNIDARKVRAAHNAMVSVIEYLANSNLRAAASDSQLLDDANNLRRRIADDARRVGVEVR